MITKAQKGEIVANLADKFKRQKIAIFSDFSGVSVGKSQVLRRLLKKEDAEYKVGKKTLFDRALAETSAGIATKDMKGEIGVAFGYGDQVAPARILAKFAKDAETFKILGGILGSRILTDREVLTLARLPSREILLAQVVRSLFAPLRGFTSVLQGNIRNLAFVLNQVKGKKE